MRFLSSFLFGLVFLSESTHYEKQKKKHKKKKQFTNQSNKHIIVSKFFRLSCEKSVKSMCYLKFYIQVYLMHKTNHALLVNRRRMDRNKIQSGDKIQNGCDHKFCRLTS